MSDTMKRKDNSKEIQELASEFMDKVLPLLTYDEIPTHTTLNLLTSMSAALLALSAVHGAIKSNPGYNVKQRMVFMGNQAVVCAIEGLEKDGKMEDLVRMDEMMKMLSGLSGDET